MPSIRRSGASSRSRTPATGARAAPATLGAGRPYATFFDHAEDTLTLRRLQCFDFEGLERFPAVLEPLLFYILHRASATIRDQAEAATLKLFVLDEAWRFVRDATVKQYITEALKTWRKRNAAMILATQSTEDFADHGLLRTVLESCPTKFFLANPGIDTARVRDLFHLNHTEAARIATPAAAPAGAAEASGRGEGHSAARRSEPLTGSTPTGRYPPHGARIRVSASRLPRHPRAL